ncbi:MAG: diacylglycerol kinase family protein [Verrucomicrobia bacterium]|nr:diacylglycerol kinase family protein [Verrucomicrobiota bacterium]
MNSTSPSGSRLRSFGYAFAGMRTLLATQPNARIHVAAAACVVVAGFLAGLTRAEWCAIVFAIAMVIVTEALNTALEFLADATSPGFHPFVKKSKDVAAAAVLMAAICAIVIGLLVFGPHLMRALHPRG